MSFVNVAPGSDFPLENLPWGVFEHNGKRSIGVAIGDHVLNVTELASRGFITGPELNSRACFSQVIRPNASSARVF